MLPNLLPADVKRQIVADVEARSPWTPKLATARETLARIQAQLADVDAEIAAIDAAYANRTLQSDMGALADGQMRRPLLRDQREQLRAAVAAAEREVESFQAQMGAAITAAVVAYRHRTERG